MVRVVVDTDIIIDFLRTEKGGLKSLLDKQIKGEIELFISTGTFFELFSGQSSKKTESPIQDVISAIKTVPIDDEIAKLAGEINRDYKLDCGPVDVLIAATTFKLDAELTTKNQKHFSKIPKRKFFNL